MLRSWLAFLIGLSLAGCVSTDLDDDSEVKVVDGESLLRFLDDQGILLRPVGISSLATPPLSGTRYQHDNSSGSMTIFEFRSEADADLGVTSLRRGAGVQTVRRIYRRGRLVVFYLGQSSILQVELTRALGRPVVT